MTGATIGRLEAELSRHPDSRGIAANIISLRKLHSKLEHDFGQAAEDIGLDVLHYRLLEERPTAKALSRSVGTFQDALAVAYDALRHGPKMRRSISPSALAETELRVAYSYPGSFGVVFTVPNERLLIPDMQSYFDRAAETVVQLGKAHEHKEVIVDAEKRVGRATLAAVYDWAKANAQSRTDTAIEWRRGDKARGEALIQVPEFVALSESLERIARTIEETMTLTGTLVGGDISSRRFHFVTTNDEDIRGRFADAISESQVAQLPGRYTAVVRKTTEITYATDEEKLSYFLDKLGQPL
jgi:hypothetical protein